MRIYRITTHYAHVHPDWYALQQLNWIRSIILETDSESVLWKYNKIIAENNFVCFDL
jgi:hypothetical protein